MAKDLISVDWLQWYDLDDTGYQVILTGLRFTGRAGSEDVTDMAV